MDCFCIFAKIMKTLATISFLERPIENLDWVLYILIFSMTFIVIGRVLFNNNFESLNKIERFQEVNDNQSLFGLMFQLLYAILFSTILTGYLTMDYDYIFHLPIYKALAFGGIILIFFFVRSIMGKVASYAFGIAYDKNFNLKIFNYYRAYSVGILWLVVLLFYFSDIKKLILLAILAALLLIIRVMTYKMIFNNQQDKQTKIWYYNILYLCALEALPLLVLLKFLNIW